MIASRAAIGTSRGCRERDPVTLETARTSLPMPIFVVPFSTNTRSAMPETSLPASVLPETSLPRNAAPVVIWSPDDWLLRVSLSSMFACRFRIVASWFRICSLSTGAWDPDSAAVR